MLAREVDLRLQFLESCDQPRSNGIVLGQLMRLFGCGAARGEQERSWLVDNEFITDLEHRRTMKARFVMRRGMTKEGTLVPKSRIDKSPMLQWAVTRGYIVPGMAAKGIERYRYRLKPITLLAPMGDPVEL